MLKAAEKLKRSTLTIRPRIHFTNRNNEKYVDKQSNGDVIGQKIMNEVEKIKYRSYIYSSSLMKHKTINSNTDVLTGIKLKEINSFLKKIITLFILREHNR